ncbi:M23 family metallopeptidase [Agromyces sp. SYSU T00194]|uniref:M23 family metallopeptidase n=1 Tax=Agromyces chitinivorans TaxID=3158560 RepID=UPI00339875A9
MADGAGEATQVAPRRARRVGTALPGLRRAIGVFGALLIVASMSVAAPAPANAADYPTWDEVKKAKANTAAGAAAVSEITDLIAQLEVRVEETRAEAERRTDELLAAQQAFDEANRRAEEIQQQADESAAEAAEAEDNAGQLAAQLYRAGGTDLGINMMLEAGTAAETDELLSKLGNMSKMVERTAGVYEEAQQAANTAKALGEQAAVARDEREQLRIAAEEALVAAQEAQAAAEAALAESEDKKIELEQQLKYLKDKEATTIAAYQEGERKRKEEEERRRKAAAAAAARAAAAAAAAAASGGGGGLAGGTTSSQGWAIPAYGYISGTYGPRTSICTPGGCSGGFHYATDLATGCSAPIYAAHSGVVVYAGYSGTYGNFIKIDHGNGIATGYAHIRYGGVFVGVGQTVSAGQNIASSGSTGASTGCHLHFEVFQNGYRINPQPFMAARGVPLG